MQQRYAYLATQLAKLRQPVVILDLEATGGNQSLDRITEVAFLRFEGGKVQSFSQLINPKVNISPFITSLTGISNEMVAHAPTFAQMLPEILPLLQGALLWAHQADFDYGLLRNECYWAGERFSGSSLCTVKLSKFLYPKEKKHNLDTIAQRFQLPLCGERHRAMTDVMMLADFLQAAFRENEAKWQNAVQFLSSPAILSADLPPDLVVQVAQLHDGYGVVVWEKNGQQWVRCCRHVYREMVAWLNGLKAHERADWHLVACVETVGELHNIAVYAEFVRQNPQHAPETGACTAIFEMESGCLKARIRHLREGVYAAPPTGLFWHPKGGKRAVLAWAKQYGLCLKRLGALPYSLPQSAPCPAALTDGCACQSDEVAQHNARVQQFAAHLPMVDDLHLPRARICEHDKVSGVSHSFIVERGALLLDDGQWFVSADLFNILKNKWKHARRSFEWLDV